MEKKSKPIFGYWNIRGFGQPIRFILRYLGIEHEEKTYNCSLETKFSEWDAQKNQLGLDFPNLPYWIDDEVRMTESRAIIKHIARKYSNNSLMPTTGEGERKAEILDGVITDIWASLADATYLNSLDTISNYERNVPMKLSQIVNFMGKNEWILRNELSYLDFVFYEILYHNLVFKSQILDEFPTLVQYIKRFEEIPQIAQFIQSPSYIKKPCFRPWARVQI